MSTREIALTAGPVIAVLLGGILTAFHRPGPRTQSAVQHLAAGAVFAAVSTEVIPTIVHADQVRAVVTGFLLGTAVMVTLKAFEGRLERSAGRARAAGLFTATSIDVAIDGLVLGLGFAAGRKEGLLLAFALTLELVFLGVSVAAEVGGAARRVVATSIVLAGLLVAGVIAGIQLGDLSAWTFTALLAFGSAALLYLVTEELLVDAHEHADTPFTPALFFLAFLAVLVVDMTA